MPNYRLLVPYSSEMSGSVKETDLLARCLTIQLTKDKKEALLATTDDAAAEQVAETKQITIANSAEAHNCAKHMNDTRAPHVPCSTAMLCIMLMITCTQLLCRNESFQVFPMLMSRQYNRRKVMTDLTVKTDPFSRACNGTHNSNTLISITKENFKKKVIGRFDRNIFVMYFMPPIEHSPITQLEWLDFAEQASRQHLPLDVAVVNCFVEVLLCFDLEMIKIFPTARWYPALSSVSHDFDGIERSSDYMDFAKSMLDLGADLVDHVHELEGADNFLSIGSAENSGPSFGVRPGVRRSPKDCAVDSLLDPERSKDNQDDSWLIFDGDDDINESLSPNHETNEKPNHNSLEEGPKTNLGQSLSIK